MTEKPWETESGPGAPSADSALDALKKEADSLGVQYAANIGASTLAARIDEHKQANSTPPAPPTPPTPPTPPAPPATPNPDADKPEPTVVTPQPEPGADINAQKADEKVSKADRKATKASINWDNQAPLEVINMVSQGMSVADAKAKHAEALAIRAKREAERRGEDEEAEE